MFCFPKFFSFCFLLFRDGDGERRFGGAFNWLSGFHVSRYYDRTYRDNKCMNPSSKIYFKLSRWGVPIAHPSATMQVRYCSRPALPSV